MRRAADRSAIFASPFHNRRSQYGRADGDGDPRNACSRSGVDWGERGIRDVSRDNRGSRQRFVRSAAGPRSSTTQGNQADGGESFLGGRAPAKQYRRGENRGREDRP